MSPPSPWLTALAFTMVIVPFAIALIRLLLASGQHLYLPDDLALIDFYTRRALAWKQQLGVFDHFGWNHPGPTYFYLLSVGYRVLGSGAKAMVVGATLINALAASACLGVIRRKSTPARTLWAAVCICVLAALLAGVGPGSITYSEGALGALVSPWNPLVIIFPLLLFIVLCASAIDRSPLSLVGALLVGTFIIQTNISALPLVAGLLAFSAFIWALSGIVRWARARWGASQALVEPQAPPAVRGHWGLTLSRVRPWVLAAVGIGLFVLMWLPPVIQQRTNHPGNIGLIVRFFRAGHPGQTLKASVWAVVAVGGTLIAGPAEIMNSVLGGVPYHPALSVVLSVAVVAIAATVVVGGVWQRNRFAAGLGALCLVGIVAMVIAGTRVVGLYYGYLAIWAITVPVAALIGVGMLRMPARAVVGHGQPISSTRAFRLVLCTVGLVSCVVLVVRVAMIPPLSAISDPHVGRLESLARPALQQQGGVFVSDNGAGQPNGLIDTEEFIGLVNRLDQAGFRPTVNDVWTLEFGPTYLSTGHELRRIELDPWTSGSPSIPGYRGRVGDIAVVITDAQGRPVGG
jgi:hypothetical protein